jgi:Rhodanese-like domain
MVSEANSLEVDLDTFAEAFASGATILDVRNPDEYETAHVPGAVLIPLPELAARQDEIPHGDPLYVICAGGGRSLTGSQSPFGFRGHEWLDRAGRGSRHRPGSGLRPGLLTPRTP